MRRFKINPVLLLVPIISILMGMAIAQDVPKAVAEKGVFFSTEEDFVTQGPEPRDGNPIISDGDLLNSSGFVYMRNSELLRLFQVKFDLGLDAADVIDINKRSVAFSTELDHPGGMFTAGDLLATNGAILPNSALLAAFHIPRDLDLGLDAVHFIGSKDTISTFLEIVKRQGREYWLKNPEGLMKYLKQYGIDIWFSVEGTAPTVRSPMFLDGDLLSAATGTIVLSNRDALPGTVPAGIPNRGVDFGMDAVTIYRGQMEPIKPRCVDFEDLQLGTEYRVGDTFTDAGVKIAVQRFQWSNGQWTDKGFAKVENGGKAGGSGQELRVNNVNLDFNFGGPCDSLTLLFGEYGGNLNIKINGAFKNFQNFIDINSSSIGGVHVHVVPGPSVNKGSLKLVGTINSFAIGGQELWIDHICCCCPHGIGRILFSTEIKGMRPIFTDGDVIRAGNGVVMPNHDLIQHFKPKAKFLGLDALSLGIEPVPRMCVNQITHIGGLKTHVANIGTDGRAKLLLINPTHPTYHPFGDHIPIWGEICDDVIRFRVLYDDLSDGPDYPTGDPIAVQWGKWKLKDFNMGTGCTVNWPLDWGTTNPNGWYDGVLFRKYRDMGNSADCNNDLALTNWDTGPSSNPNSLTPATPKVSDGLYAVWLEWETASGIDREPMPHNVRVDNHYTTIHALEIPVGIGHCPIFSGTNTSFMVRGQFSDDHFLSYQLVIDGDCYPGSGHAYGRHYYYDSTPESANLDDTGTKPDGSVVDLHKVDLTDVPPPGQKLKDCAYSVKLKVWDRTIIGCWSTYGGPWDGHFRSWVYDEKYFTYKTSP